MPLSPTLMRSPRQSVIARGSCRGRPVVVKSAELKTQSAASPFPSVVQLPILPALPPATNISRCKLSFTDTAISVFWVEYCMRVMFELPGCRSFHATPSRLLSPTNEDPDSGKTTSTVSGSWSARGPPKSCAPYTTLPLSRHPQHVRAARSPAALTRFRITKRSLSPTDGRDPGVPTCTQAVMANDAVIGMESSRSSTPTRPRISRGAAKVWESLMMRTDRSPWKYWEDKGL
mmetsp:Transcript_43251/g.113918  ORF Transcript_43251/g.113918 Transcript_43251/m.113918 type:complete len:232 (-) Transcript_43251:356-1051(-)